MAKKAREPVLPAPREVAPQQGIELLLRQIEKGEELFAKRPIQANDYSSWELLTRNYLEKAFGKGSPNVSSIMGIGKYGSFPMSAPESWWENHRAESLARQLTNMRGLVELFQTEDKLQNVGVVTPESVTGGHRVFLVHGHDERAFHETARFSRHRTGGHHSSRAAEPGADDYREVRGLRRRGIRSRTAYPGR